MNKPTMDKLVLRMNRLEKENRRWKMLGICVVALGMFLLIGATQRGEIIIADTVRAKHFTLLGDDGVPYGFWETIKNRPFLLFVDKELHTLVKLTTYPHPSLELSKGVKLYGGKRNPRLWVGKVMLGPSELAIFSEDHKKQTKLFISPDGSASLELYDKDGNKRAVLGSTSLEITRTGTETKTAESSLVLFDKKGKVLWSAP